MTVLPRLWLLHQAKIMSLLNKGTSRMSEHCGNCDHYHYLKQRKVDCIVDGELHDTGNSCDDYKKRVTGKTLEARLTEALEVRRIKEAKAAEQRKREFDEKMAEKAREHDRKLWRASLWWQAALVVSGAILGVIGTLIVQASTK